MFLKLVFLGVLGVIFGAAIAGGLVAFAVNIGVFTRYIGKSHTSRHIYFYEHVILAGALYGNIMSMYDVPMVGGIFGVCIFGVFAGIFVGSLSISIAEIIDVFPIVFRRVKIKVGLPFLIFSFGLGKMCGCLLFFWKNMKA